MSGSNRLMYAVLFSILALGVSATASLPVLKTKVTRLEPFHAIRDCLPVNVKIEPGSKRTGYALKVEGETSLVNAVDARVSDGVLSLGLSSCFETERVIAITVQVPRSALRAITKSSSSILVIVPGLKVNRLTVTTSGAATVRLFKASISRLVANATDDSVVYAQGKIDRARVDVTASASAYCYGIRKASNVNASGLGRIFLRPRNSNVELSGSTQGLGRVYTTVAECNIAGPFIQSGCEVIDANALPAFGATYSCGLIVDGEIKCNAEGNGTSTVTTSSSTGRSSSSAFSSARSRGTVSTTARASVSTSSTGRGSVTRATSSDHTSSAHRINSGLVTTDGTVSIATKRCLDSNLSMFE